MTRGACPLRRFEAAVTRSAARAGTPLAIEAHRGTAWHSATFTGHRHALEACAPPSPALERWLGALPGLELAVAGAQVAELKLGACLREGAAIRFRIEGVTVATG